MYLPEQFESNLKKSEGFRSLPYEDEYGNITIGWGHNLSADGVSQNIAQQLFSDDVSNACVALVGSLPWVEKLDQVRFWTLVEMTFNMGIHTLLLFHNMLNAIQAENWAEAKQQALDSKWAKDVGVARSTRLANQLETGQWH